MIIEFNCKCGNNDPLKAYEYHGMLGYEAFVCTVCGRYSNYDGEHEPSEWSKQFIRKDTAE